MTNALAMMVVWLGPVDHVHTVEINTFGTERVRISVIYRDADGTIIDWRWLATRKQIPEPLGDGRYIAVWDDGGRPRTVVCREVLRTRSAEDREYIERAMFPDRKRRNLSR